MNRDKMTGFFVASLLRMTGKSFPMAESRRFRLAGEGVAR